MMMLKTINMLSLPVQVRADESDEARAARLTQNRDHMAEVKHVILLTLMMFMDMFSMIMLSMLIQAWAALSEEEREGRRAQMREHNAEVNHDNVADVDDIHRHVLFGDVIYADPGMGGSVRAGKGGSACSDKRSQC